MLNYCSTIVKAIAQPSSKQPSQRLRRPGGDLLDHLKQAEDRRGNLIFYLLVTMIIIYVAVPSYGVIRDLVGPGEVVFVLSPPPDAAAGKPGLVERIHDLIFPSRDIPVPILQRIDLSGRVLYTDQTPFVKGLIELKSEPRYTRTDMEGYFVFIDIEEGAHTVSVLDEAGNILARCEVEIKRNMEIQGVELTRHPDGTIVFQVAVDVKVLEITLVLTKDGDGKVIGIERVELGHLPLAAEKPVIPDKPSTPPVPQEESSLPEPVDRFEFRVFDTVSRYIDKGTIDINIFGAKKRIAPGMRGTYQFTVDNRENPYPSRYYVDFTPVDTLPTGNKIPMLYRLKADGVYVAGGGDWSRPEELKQDAVLPGRQHVKYTLEWYWQEGANDNKFAEYADNPAYSYSLTIKVQAQRR